MTHHIIALIHVIVWTNFLASVLGLWRVSHSLASYDTVRRLGRWADFARKSVCVLALLDVLWLLNGGQLTI